MKVTIVGAGYVGLNTGLSLAYLGHDVTLAEKSADRIAMLRQGKSPIYEHGVNELLAILGDKVKVTDNTTVAVSDAEVILIAVSTPPGHGGQADTTFVEAAARETAMGLVEGREYVVTVKSTVPIGANRRVSHQIRKTLAQRGVDCTVRFASNPEFLRQGTALHDSLYPDRIVVGAEEPEAHETLQKMYSAIIDQSFEAPEVLPRPSEMPKPIWVAVDLTSAEMIKYAANTFLAMKISFSNEIAGLCERVGGDVTNVMHAIGLDTRIGGKFLNAGLGWGGSCFPKDTLALTALAEEYGYTMPITEAVRVVNQRQRKLVIEKLLAALKGLRGQTVGILGLAFKPETDDVRDAPAIDVIRQLVDLGAFVQAHDPVAEDNARRSLEGVTVDYVADPYDAALGASALVLATEWKAYLSLDLKKLADLMDTPILIDARNAIDPDKARAAGFDYYGLGR